MIGWGEIVAAVRGSLRLLADDPRGMAAFDLSFAGFWRSFGVALLMSPAALVSILADRSFAESDASTGLLFLVGGLSYVLGWIAFPVVMLLLARPLGLEARYVPLMVVRNWTTVLGSLPYALVTLLWLVGGVPRRLMFPAIAAALGFELFLAYRSTRIAAAVPPPVAAGLVVLDLLLTMLVDTEIARLFAV
jgi:hypothetical protein